METLERLINECIVVGKGYIVTSFPATSYNANYTWRNIRRILIYEYRLEIDAM